MAIKLIKSAGGAGVDGVARSAASAAQGTANDAAAAAAAAVPAAQKDQPGGVAALDIGGRITSPSTRMPLKTINGEALYGTGNIVVAGGSSLSGFGEPAAGDGVGGDTYLQREYGVTWRKDAVVGWEPIDLPRRIVLAAAGEIGNATTGKMFGVSRVVNEGVAGLRTVLWAAQVPLWAARVGGIFRLRAQVHVQGAGANGWNVGIYQTQPVISAANHINLVSEVNAILPNTWQEWDLQAPMGLGQNTRWTGTRMQGTTITGVAATGFLPVDAGYVIALIAEEPATPDAAGSNSVVCTSFSAAIERV